MLLDNTPPNDLSNVTISELRSNETVEYST